MEYTVMRNDPTPPDACATMGELRAAIDALDARLVSLLALRQRYIERAAILKQTRGAVRDDARVEEVVRHVIEEGKRAGLSPMIAERVWRNLIEASIAHEIQAFDAKGAAAR
jgi:isochorismate pyruvate lyase